MHTENLILCRWRLPRWHRCTALSLSTGARLPSRSSTRGCGRRQAAPAVAAASPAAPNGAAPTAAQVHYDMLTLKWIMDDVWYFFPSKHQRSCSGGGRAHRCDLGRRAITAQASTIPGCGPTSGRT
jgi:hypothetical protein